MYGALAGLLLLSSCIRIENAFVGLPPGPWRAEITLTENPDAMRELEDEISIGIEEIAQGKLPFNFEVTYESDSSFYLEILNGEERIRVDDITMGLDRSTGRDTILIRFPGFETYVDGEFEENEIRGDFVDPTRGPDYRLPFRARFGQDHRFTRLRKTPAQDLSGKWEVAFEIETDEPYPAVGVFEQEGNALTGTFLTESGDYRYLEGTVQADKAYLSAFDGAHLFLFEAKMQPDGSLLGSFRSGKHYRSLWKATRNENARLPELTEYIEVVDPDPFDLTFELPNGEPYRISEIDAGVKLVQIMGTWCPNCKDETEFLVEFLKDHPEDAITALGVAYERRPRKEAVQYLPVYARKMNIPYPIAYGGSLSKEEAGKTFSMLSEIQAWPTLLVLDQNNRIRRVYSGFLGPATSGFTAFQEDFGQITQELMEEYRSKG
jgi:thiol-disulfide isomerase/thioredoxin